MGTVLTPPVVTAPAPPGFWRTVALMLKVAHRRSGGRQTRQRQLLRQRTGKSESPFGALAIFGSVILGLLIHVLAAVMLNMGVDAAQRYEAERDGKIVVSDRLEKHLQGLEYDRENFRAGYGLRTEQERLTSEREASADSRRIVSSEAKRISEKYGGKKEDIEKQLWAEIISNGGARLVSEDRVETGVKGLAGSRGMPQMIGSLVLLLWLIMMVCQGEGMELDLQRRRHPMWEWLLSHPVPPGAVFLAEMLTPISANSVYWCGPVFVGVLFGMVYGFKLGVFAALLAGVPVTVGAACLGKALEIGVMIRFSPRSRGGILGLMSWLGYALLMLSFAGFYFMPRLVMAGGGLLHLLGALDWQWLLLFLGTGFGSGFHFAGGLAVCWLLSVAMTTAGVGFSLWGTQKGLSGNYGNGDARVKRGRGLRAGIGRDPLYRKEFLWFIRDRGAIVQAVLIPITAAGYQIFNLRGLLAKAQGEWNYLCGAAICFGTYFLWVLGPKSLTSEGQALWIPLTWPKGLEGLLKAKAWLWAMISTGIVVLVMGYAAILYPRDIWKIALVLLGWFLFARSMAEKSVTLVRVASSSGEMQKTPTSTRWATQLGMLTFSIGIITQQWNLAVVGIVFSYITAAAMWQNFRARLPFLYDPWSETLPPPPTLMHSMVAIGAMLELTSIVTMIAALFTGRDHLGLAMLFGYGISSVCVSLGTMHFLSNRHVPPSRIWNWPAGAHPDEPLPGEETEARSDNNRLSILAVHDEQKPKFTLKQLIANLQALIPWTILGIVAGMTLGAMAHGYTLLLEHIPAIEDLLRKSAEQMHRSGDVRMAYGILAVCFAPFAEEFLFRGLLYRTLDREWGGWKAVVGSAAFFTIYHPPLAWLPVFTLGVLNAMLFKKSGKLLPAVALHMVYNLVVSVW